MQSAKAAPCQHLKKHGAAPNPDFIEAAVSGPLDRFAGRHISHVTLGWDQPGPDGVVMRSNDYLSLAGDPRIARAKAEELLAHGHGDAISRVFVHDRNDAHRAFEHRFAELLRAEDAVLAMSGYNANTGLMQAFAGKDVVVYLDHRAHASLWEGVSAARARAIPFRHNDAGDLARKIRHFGPGIVAVDALYSTDGHVAPLVDIVAAAEAGGCAIIVDETHSFGCQGPGGAGIVVELGLEDRVHFRTVGLSKAVAARGGMVVGSARNMEFFRYEAFPMIFSTSVLGYEIAGFDKTLDIIRDEPWRREQLAVNQRFLRDGLADVGYDVTRSDRQIVAIITGGFEDTVFFREALAKRGIFGSVFCPPATPKGASLIRFTLNCSLTATDLDRTIAACDDIRRKGSTIGLASRARVRSVPGGTTRNGPESRSN